MTDPRVAALTDFMAAWPWNGEPADKEPSRRNLAETLLAAADAVDPLRRHRSGDLMDAGAPCNDGCAAETADELREELHITMGFEHAGWELVDERDAEIERLKADLAALREAAS